MPRRVPIELVVTDLDNTLYDWYTSFVPAFYAMVETAAKILQTPARSLLDELKVVHQRFGNSEVPYALLDTPTVADRYPGYTQTERARALDPAFHSFNRVRKQNLRMYPAVEATLEAIRERGCPIVAHTEALVPNSLFRLHALDLARYIEVVYAPEGRAIGHPYPERLESFEPLRRFVRILPASHRKPDPEILLDICRDHRVPAEQVVYVGDSKARDIAMAKMAGTWAAYAEYGTKYPEEMWKGLVAVTHWSAEDVEREKKVKQQVEAMGITPDLVLTEFSDLLRPFASGDDLAQFEFRRPRQ